MATAAGGSSGITCWGSAIVEAARRLRTRLESDHGGTVPAGGHENTGEVRVPRLLAASLRAGSSTRRQPAHSCPVG